MIDEALSGEAGFRERARRTFHAGPSRNIFDPRSGRARGDWDLNPELRADIAVMGPPRDAAVLVPVVMRNELSVLLTTRPEHMKTHAGQVSFPGGKLEAGDAGPVDAALREAEEEIGLTRQFVEPLGFLDSYRTGSGFLIMPVVALVHPGFSLTIDPDEVADAFEVPLRFLMDDLNHERHSREWRGRERFFYAISYQDRYIWGATAGIIKNMHERLLAK